LVPAVKFTGKETRGRNLEWEGLKSSATCSCIVELKESVTLSRIFLQIETFHGFSLSIIDRGTEKLRCGGAHSDPICVLLSIKRRVRAARPRYDIRTVCSEDVRFAMQGHHMGFAFSDGG
jgi:hypothetical protein